MRKMFFFAMFVAAAMTCAAENESVVVINNAAGEPESVLFTEAEPETNVAEIVLNDIDPVVNSSFYVSEDRNVYFVECGSRFIRVKDLNGKLVSTISRYLSEEAGIWVENADCVMLYEGQFLPAKRVLNGKGITYRAAKHRQWVPMNRVRSVEKEYRIWL